MPIPIGDFVLQYAEGDAWKDVPETATVDNRKVDWQCRFRPITAQRIRLLVQKAKIDVARIWEIELYEPKLEHTADLSRRKP